MRRVQDFDSSGTGQARLLVCDDSPTVRAMMASLLGRHHSVQLTSSGEEALARAPEFAPDLVISDLLMPGMSGRDLIARLRAIPAFEDVPMILLTAVSDAESRTDGLEAGADDYLVKPIRERELLARVASLLRLRRTVIALSQRTRALEEANLAVRMAQERLARTERLAALGSLAAALAHDINNPLSIVTSGASALGAIVEEARQRPEVSASAPIAALLEELATVSGEVALGSRRLQGIGRDLRLFGSGTGAAVATVRGDEAAHAAVSLVRSRASVPPRIDVDVLARVELEAPPHLVTLALVSLLDRAVLAAGAEGRVRVTVGSAQGEGEIAVHDDGPKIPDALLPRVFEPFTRSGSSPTTAGLGLSVAAGIVLGLGGHIDVDGALATGACFRLRLPLVAPAR